MIKMSDFTGLGAATTVKTRGRGILLKMAKLAIPTFMMLFYAGVSWGQTTLFSENFTASNGTTSDTQWGLDMSGCSVNGSKYLKVQSNQMEARGPSCNATWNSITFDISGYSNVSLSASLSESGTLESDDRLQILYSIDGGRFSTLPPMAICTMILRVPRPAKQA